MLVLCLTLWAMLPCLVHAQEETPDSSRVPGFTSGRVTEAQEGTDTTVYHPTKSPGKAMLLSAVLPGSGQFYNESYWKVPIVVGFGVYLVYNWIDNNRLYKNYRDQYRVALQGDPSGVQPLTRNLGDYREFYKDQRDSFTWYLLIWYFITLADAYVDASLYDFNVSGNLSLQTAPVLSPVPVGGIQFTVRVGF